MNPLKNAKVVGDGIANESYLGQMTGISRGHPEFVISRSELMLFATCPSRWKDGFAFKDTDATFFGSLVDCLLTTPDQFSKRYVERPATYPAGKKHPQVVSHEIEEGDPVPWSAAAKWCKQWVAQNKGKEPVSAEDMADAQAAVKRFKEDLDIAALLACSKKQVMCVAEYHDEETGLVIPTKCLIDLVPEKTDLVLGMDSFLKPIYAKTVLSDIKTTRSAAMRPWLRALDENQYDAQAAMNLDHYNSATGEARHIFLFALMENVFPFQPAKRQASEQFIEFGRDKYLYALRLYCKCLKSGRWPGYEDGWGLCEPDAWHSVLKH